MSLFISIGLFLVVLFILVLVHEWGHYIMAKLTGMRVDEFAIGFPPRLFSVRRGETLYTLNILPIGGFVRIYGENPIEAVDEAIVVSEYERTRAFGARPRWAQILVLLAGVTMNMIFAWFLLFIILLMGVQTAVDEGHQSANAQLMITSVLAHSPADGLIPPRSTVHAVTVGSDTLTALTPSEFSAFVIAHPNSALRVTYTHSNDEKTVTLTPHDRVLSSTSTKPAIGVALTLVEITHYSFGAAMVQAAQHTITATGKVVGGLWHLLDGVVMGTADYSQVSGPVGIVQYVGDAAAIGFTSVLYFMAIISINLAVINLLPVPALDGGRIIFVLIEAIIRRPLNPIWVGRVNFVGFALLMLLMVVVTAHDIVRIW